MGNPHVLVIPFPGQGRVQPLMELSQGLAKNGIKITVANTEHNHKLVMNALAKEEDDRDHQIANPIQLVSTRCGDHKESQSLEMMFLPAEKVKELTEEINASESDKITCVLVDTHFAWDNNIAAEMGIRQAAFCASSAAECFSIYNIPKLIEDGIIDNEGIPKIQMFQLSPTMPPMSTSYLFWLNCGIKTDVENLLFKHGLKINKSMMLADWALCNSTYDLEPATVDMKPNNILLIGPLLASNQSGNSIGNLMQEDLSCLKWLDQRATQLVIYVASGTSTTSDQTQFQEFMLGIELSNRPFLMVVSPDTVNKLDDAFLEGFRDRVGARGLITSWAPQQKVLKHPSIACFFTHCGWNSTIEALSNGVPLLCWPFIFDQFHNENFICHVWKVGLRFNRDQGAIVTREDVEIK